MSQQDKPHAEIDLAQVFSRIVSEYESGNIEKINLHIDLGLKNPTYDNLEAHLKAKDEVIQGLIVALEFYALEPNCYVVYERNDVEHRELNDDTYRDEEISATARRAIAWAKEKMNTNTKEKK